MGTGFGKAARAALAAVAMLVGAGAGCEAEDGEGGPGEDEMALGEVDDLKADGAWGAALTCKPLPDVPVLKDPAVVVSLDGLTLRLYDRAGDYEKVFPIGPGSVEKGASLTPVSDRAAGQTFWLRLDRGLGREVADARKAQPWAYAYDCKYWWKDPQTGQQLPVFAGLPFLRMEGAPSLAYAIHGPIDSYTTATGGRLRRGYVSHGCIRMEAADVLELAARLRGKKVPVRVQDAVERRADGESVDVDPRWLMSECATDADCPFPGGSCRRNEWAVRGWCTAACQRYCSLDRYGYPTSFCVADPEDGDRGVCTAKATSLNNDCRRYSGFAKSLGEPRFGQASVTADVCLPGSGGWIGSPCFSDGDCAGLAGGRCALDGSDDGRPGFCTLACTRTCPDRAGEAGTFCVDAGGKGTCMARCLRQDDCAAGYACTSGVPRFHEPAVKAGVCL